MFKCEVSKNLFSLHFFDVDWCRTFRMTSIDDKLLRQQINDYLIQLDIVKQYLQQVLKEKLPALLEFQERLHNGVYLAKLACKLSPEKEFKVFDSSQKIYDNLGIQYKHIDNIAVFLEFLQCIQLPVIFHPDVADIYEKKNIPKLIYCLKALIFHKDIPELERNRESFSDNIGNLSRFYLLNCNFNKLPDFIAVKETEDKLDQTLEELVESLNICSYSQFTRAFTKFIVTRTCLCSVEDEALRLYFDEFLEMQDVIKPLPQAEKIVNILNMAHKTYQVNITSHRGNFLDFKDAIMELAKDSTFSQNFIVENIGLYYETIKKIVDAKMREDFFNKLLTHVDLIDCMKEINKMGIIK